MQQFSGTESYLTSPELRDTVNVAITLERPLLIKGEPGTGKTLLAEAIAESLEMELLTWHVKSTTKAQDGLYVYDTVQRLNDARFNDRDISDVSAYIKLGPLGQAIKSEKRKILLIDEIDKADMEFPNDLLHELDKMSFSILETSETVTATERPIVIITSNNEKELPDAFLRRCFFHYIRFPDKETMEQIVQVHYPDLKKELLREALESFFEVREVPGLKKRPSTSELLDWIKLLVAEDIPPEALREQDGGKAIPPLYGALLKNEQDVHLFERLAFLHRRNAG